MPELLKDFFSAKVVRRLATDIERVSPAFEARSFVRQASKELGELELLDRGKHIANALHSHLPKEYPQAIDVLLRSLGPQHSSDELLGVGMAPFYYLPHLVFVAERGLDHFDLSLHAQYELTQRFTAEFSIRAFIAKDPERTFAKLREWASADKAHVRRLVSEGTRLRLPWASRVAWLDANPARVLELLELLKTDPASVVRRSVANNLNDLSKVYPELVIDTCRSWLQDASPETRALVKHALRTLIKKGHRGALTLLGAGKRPRVVVRAAQVAPRSVRIGGDMRFSFTLESTASRAQELLVDYAVHFVKANGTRTRRVFKLKRVTLAARGTCEFQGKVSFAPMSTRKHYPGRHNIEVLVNGEGFALGELDVCR